MPILTLLDVATRNGTEKEIGIIEEINKAAPEVTQLHTVTGSKTSFSVQVRVGIPKPGFRTANTPATFVASKYKKVNVELMPMSTVAFVDDITLQTSDDSEPQVLADEATGVAQGAILSAGAQMFYGLRFDKKGFPGLPDYVDGPMLITANPAKEKTEEGTSVYLVASGHKGVQFRYGKNRTLHLGPWREMTIPGTDPETGEPGLIPGKGANFSTFLAMISLSKGTQARLKNLGTGEGTTLNDDMLADLIETFPRDVTPTHFIMNRQSASQLRKSRQAVVASVNGGSIGGGSVGSAPMPTEAHGIPIIITDSILNDESDLSSIKDITHWGLNPGKKVANTKNK